MKLTLLLNCVGFKTVFLMQYIKQKYNINAKDYIINNITFDFGPFSVKEDRFIDTFLLQNVRWNCYKISWQEVWLEAANRNILIKNLYRKI